MVHFYQSFCQSELTSFSFILRGWPAPPGSAFRQPTPRKSNQNWPEEGISKFVTALPSKQQSTMRQNNKSAKFRSATALEISFVCVCKCITLAGAVNEETSLQTKCSSPSACLPHTGVYFVSIYMGFTVQK